MAPGAAAGGASLTTFWVTLRSRASLAAARRAERNAQPAGERWLRLAAALAPHFGMVHRDMLDARRRQGDDRLGALALAQRFAHRFEQSADAWVALGQANVAAYRPTEALAAFERALQLEERADAAMFAGELYARRGDHATAGARYARAYAAGGGTDALRANALALRQAGDADAARQAVELWERETGKRWSAAGMKSGEGG